MEQSYDYNKTSAFFSLACSVFLFLSLFVLLRKSVRMTRALNRAVHIVVGEQRGGEKDRKTKGTKTEKEKEKESTGARRIQN